MPILTQYQTCSQYTITNMAKGQRSKPLLYFNLRYSTQTTVIVVYVVIILLYVEMLKLVV